MKNLEKKIQDTVDLYKTNQLSKAEKLGKKLLSQNSQVPFLYNLLGLIYYGQGRISKALEYYEKGLKIKPDYAMIYNNLGTLYKSKREYDKSEDYYKRSIKLDSKLPETQSNLGNLYVEQNKHLKAISCFEKSININSKFYIGYFNLGVTHLTIGNFIESKKNIETAININPRFYNAHRILSQLIKYNENDDHLKVLKKLYNDANLGINGKIELSYALGKAFSDIKDYKKSYEYYTNGNSLRKKNIVFTLDKEINEFNKIKKLFNNNFLSKFKLSPDKKITPIFIVGMPRSGTTLIEQIISNHSKVHGGDELIFFNELIKKFFYKKGVFSIKANDSIIHENFKKISREYLDILTSLTSNHEYVTDKLPINFKWIGFIKVILPNAKIIHCMRNPRDTCLSIYKNYFTNRDLNYAYNLNDTVNFYNLYSELMDYWNKILPNTLINIEYEKLINNSENEIKSLVSKCGLNWDDNCLKFYENKRPIKTASDIQARNKIYNTSINSWKNYEEFISKFFVKLKS